VSDDAEFDATITALEAKMDAAIVTRDFEALVPIVQQTVGTVISMNQAMKALGDVAFTTANQLIALRAQVDRLERRQIFGD